MLDVCDSILFNRPILNWYEGDELNEIGKSLTWKKKSDIWRSRHSSSIYQKFGYLKILHYM